MSKRVFLVFQRQSGVSECSPLTVELVTTKNQVPGFHVHLRCVIDVYSEFGMKGLNSFTNDTYVFVK